MADAERVSGEIRIVEGEGERFVSVTDLISYLIAAQEALCLEHEACRGGHTVLAQVIDFAGSWLDG